MLGEGEGVGESESLLGFASRSESLLGLLSTKSIVFFEDSIFEWIYEIQDFFFYNAVCSSFNKTIDDQDVTKYNWNNFFSE
jgi:hypothetical protein